MHHNSSGLTMQKWRQMSQWTTVTDAKKETIILNVASGDAVVIIWILSMEF